MTRWLPERIGESEIGGADIGAEHISWCQQNLSPPLKFMVNTTISHLPFEDGFFDFIFSRSVFTHITGFLRRKLESFFRVVDIREARLEGLSAGDQVRRGYQTAVLLRRPDRFPAPGQDRGGRDS